jgi:hypothetical protein
MSEVVNNQLLTLLTQYGIAGLILYVFYRLFSNELRDLRRSIEQLSEKIERLISLIEKK